MQLLSGLELRVTQSSDESGDQRKANSLNDLEFFGREGGMISFWSNNG
jgi:hypothetical protein